jgi:hypothetical protein
MLNVNSLTLNQNTSAITNDLITKIQNEITLLNDTEKTREVSNALNLYLNEKSPENLPFLIKSIKKLNEHDGPIYVLENLNDYADTLQEFVKRNAFISNINAIEKSAPVFSKSFIDNDWKRKFKEISYDKIKGRIRDEILKLDVDFDVKLLNIKIAKDIGLSVKYKWALEPSYNKGYFTRVDSYILKSDVKIGDIIKNALHQSLPVYMNLNREESIIFVRQFKSQIKAATAIPYNPLRLPINAKNAAKMEVGDFVSIPTKMSLVVGASAGYSNIVSVSANTYYLLSGNFRVNILKVDKNRVRVKLIGMRKKGYGTGASAGYSFSLFGIKFIDKQIGHFLDTNIFRINLSKTNGENFSVDYVFNLKYKEARDAYDKFLNANLKLRVVPQNPITDEGTLTKEFFNNLIVAENIFQEDKTKPIELRRVNRIFKATNFFEQKAFNIKVGFNLIKFEAGKSYIENRVSVYDNDNKIHRFYMPVFTKNGAHSMLFGYFKERNRKTTYALLNANSKWKPTRLKSITYVDSIDDKQCFAGEFAGRIKEYKKKLGPIAEKDLNSLKLPSKKVNSYHLYFKMIVGAKTVYDIFNPKKFTPDKIWHAMYNAVAVYGDDLFYDNSYDTEGIYHDEYFYYRPSSSSPEYMKKTFSLFERNNWPPTYFSDIKKCVNSIIKLQKKNGYYEKSRFFIKLYKSQIFENLGVRFILEAMKIAGLNNNFKAELHIRAKGITPINLVYGDLSVNDRLYNELNTIIAHITDSSYDLFNVITYQELKKIQEAEMKNSSY